MLGRRGAAVGHRERVEAVREMADETLSELRQALDDAVLTRTGRSIGDLASQRVLDDIMPYITALQPAQPADEPRAIVRAFALAMERKLAANDATKGGWKKAHWFTLYRCMVMEKAELLNALEALDSVLAKLAAFDDRFEGGELLSRIDADEDELLRQLDTAKRDVLQEAADVSNYAMMIADVCGALPPTDERGR